MRLNPKRPSITKMDQAETGTRSRLAPAESNPMKINPVGMEPRANERARRSTHSNPPIRMKASSRTEEPTRTLMPKRVRTLRYSWEVR